MKKKRTARELARERPREHLVLVLRRRQHDVRHVPAYGLDHLQAFDRRRHRVVDPEPPVPHLDDRAPHVGAHPQVEPDALLLLQRPHLVLDHLAQHGASGEERDEGEREAGEVDVSPLRLVFRRRRGVARCRSNRRRPTRRRQRASRVLHRRSRTSDDGVGGYRGIPRRARRYARTRQAPRRVRHGEHHHRARGYGSLTFSLDSLKVIRSIKSYAVTRTRKRTAPTIRPSPQPSVSVVRALRRHPRHPYVRT